MRYQTRPIRHDHFGPLTSSRDEIPRADRPTFGAMLAVLACLVVIAVATFGRGLVEILRELPALFAVIAFTAGAPFLMQLALQAVR